MYQFPRKKRGFNLGIYDREYSEKTKKPRSMDFLSPPGFVSAAKLVGRGLQCYMFPHHHLFSFAEVGVVGMLDASPWMYGPDRGRLQ